MLPNFGLLLLTLTSRCSLGVSSPVDNTNSDEVELSEAFEEFLHDFPGSSGVNVGEERQGRKISSSLDEGKQHECRSTVTTLRKDEATVLKSHHGYGLEPYPENYSCRWLFLPDDCNLALKCDVGTFRNLRRSRSRFAQCTDADFLRVMGNRGHLDEFYCGNQGAEINLERNAAMALMFNSNDREDGPEDLKRLGFGLAGFECKVVCQADDNRAKGDSETTSKPAVFPTSEPEEDLANDTPTSSRSCHCGETREGRIVCPSGHNCTSQVGSIPWQAGLVHKGRKAPWCGGTLISDQYVLTAAHCLLNRKPNRIQIILGDHDWTVKTEVVEGRFDVDRFIRHPKAGRAAQFDFDFALVKLSQAVNFDRFHGIRPACLPNLEGSKDDLVGRVGYASGWGLVDPKRLKAQARLLQRVAVNIISMSDCRKKYKSNPVTDNMMCAETPGGDACFGDSGGPFTVQDLSGRYVLEGVISWGKSCADQRHPGVYAEVRSEMEWIEEIISDSQICPRDDRRRSLEVSHGDDETTE
eukprot:snap_masked-scaffold157_size297442-processed-gene-1.8 protein:Tk02797 transcript:snap_masked-scaffold157_size297442-processed-gene-1.8-mRNA-1 annotation:"coagulation factor xi"